jgi:apolipoprotein N-acyltransferase
MASENRSRALLSVVVVTVLTATLVWFGNGLDPWWPLMWLTPLPALLYSLHTSRWRAGAAAFAGWLIGSLNMRTYSQSLGIPFPGWLAVFAAIALIFAAGVLLFRALALRGRVWSAIMALPSLEVSVDWLRNWVTPHGTLADPAYTQLRFLPFLQLASLTGPWGMTFVLLLIPSAAAAFLYLRKRDPRSALRMGVVVAGILLAVLAYGAVRLSVGGQRRSVRVGLVAADAPGNDEVAAPGPDAARVLGAYAAQAALLAARGAQVVVLPEKIAVVLDRGQADDDAILQHVADATGITIVAGELHISPSSSGVTRFNRAEVYAPHAKVASYDKEHMLPPFESNLTPGTAKLTMPRDAGIWGVAICKDLDFTSTGRAYGQRNTALLLAPAWDFNRDRVWHGHVAIMRGVEGGFSLARAARNGYLTLSDDRGRVVAEARSDAAPFSTLVASLPVGHQWTLYQSWGDWFAWVAVVLFILVLIRAVAMRPSR